MMVRWGWGTWKYQWNQIDWEIKDYNQFKYNLLSQIKFSRGGSDMPGMLKKQMNGKIDSWAIRWCYNQYKKDLLTIFPSKYTLSLGITLYAGSRQTFPLTSVVAIWISSSDFLLEATPAFAKNLFKRIG